MRPCSNILAATLLFASPYASSAQLTEQGDTAKTIHLRISRPSQPRPLPASLFGSFLEPIGHAIYGGLWSDVLENPSFEDGLWSVGNVEAMVTANPALLRSSSLGLPLPWEPLTDQGARFLPETGDAANSTHSLLLMSLPGKETGIRQQVYLPVKRELRYTASVYLKHVSGPAEVTLSLRTRNRADQVLASASIAAAAPAWTKYSVELILPPGRVLPLEPADFVVATRNDGRVLVDQVSLMPQDNLEGLDPEEVAMARDLHSPLVRYGGNFTSAYDWRDGIGPLDARVSKINVSWGVPEYNTFGTEEFLHFCRLIGAQPQIALNLGSGTPDQAAAWVSYVDAHWPDAAGAHPGGLLWELGNELWGDFQVGSPSQERVAAKTLATAEAVHKVDPHARLIATGGDEDRFDSWNATQLTNPVGTFDYLSTHFVVRDQVLVQNASSDFITSSLYALPIGLEARLAAMHRQIEASAHGGHVLTAFTEWLLISGSRSSPNYDNMAGAVFTGGFLNSLLRESDLVPISDMTGIMEFGGIWKKRGVVFGVPAYWVFREYASARPASLLEVQSDSPAYSIHDGPRRLPEIRDVPYLDVTAAASEDGRELLLFCVNRHLTGTLEAEFDFSALGRIGSKVSVSTLHADTLLQKNDETAPDQVIPVRTTEIASRRYRHAFPESSVTIIRIPLS